MVQVSTCGTISVRGGPVVTADHERVYGLVCLVYATTGGQIPEPKDAARGRFEGMCVPLEVLIVLEFLAVGLFGQ